jgi:uncharacterized protein YgbK (DUF1537 family)
MTLLLGCIADDFTGATDLANTLVKSGLRTVQLIGLPADETPVPDAEAVVIALKSRSIPPDEAVEASVGALRWLQKQGARQFFFKYCSTFDSTEDGNIGPVIDGLMETLGDDFTIACPAFPDAGRTVFQGHLFVNDVLLSDSPMRHHPLNPMTDSNLVRFLGLQTTQTVDLVPFAKVAQGPETMVAAMTDLKSAGVRIAIVDALTDRHLMDIGAASRNMKLITGGSGVAMGLADNFRRLSGIHLPEAADDIPAVAGPEAVISGSCSQMTLAQVSRMDETHPVFRLDALDLADGGVNAGQVVDWAIPYMGKNQPFLIAASAPPDRVQEAQDRLGRNEAGELIEKILADIVKKLVEQGLRRLVVAGGETSGAVVQALGVKGLRIGPEIAPGVPCTVTLDDDPMALTLKSGNFGDEDFFLKALKVMP